MISAPQALSAAAICIALALPAQAQQAEALNCAPRGKVLEFFAKKYSETTVAVGLARSGGVVEILASPGGKTWTMFVNTPDGRMCMLGDGSGWQTIKPKTVKQGQKS